EGQMDVIIFAFLFILLQKKLTRGYLFVIYNILYSIGRFLLEMLRGDDPRYLFHWTTAQWTAIVMIVISVIAAIYLSVQSKRRQKTE
ncbi:MAG: lgt 2, partial [Bacilli bacterium]|nr:lgt 2 [Bacilli bacterium]